MKKYDILILGNGILGLSTAFYLILDNSNLKIGIVGPKRRIGSASLAAGAMLGCFAEVTSSTFKSEYGLQKLDIAYKAKKKWPQLADSLNSILPDEDQFSIQDGTYVIHNTQSTSLDDETYSSIMKSLDLYKEPYKIVPSSEVSGYSPLEMKRALKTIHIPDEGFINSSLLFKAYEDVLNQYENIEFINETAEKIVVIENKFSHILTQENALLYAEKVLICAGAFSQKLIDTIPELARRVPRILSGVGYSFLISGMKHQVKSVIRTLNRAGACGIHMVPYNDTDLYIGASNTISIEPMIHWRMRSLHFLMEGSMEQMNTELSEATISKINTGNRPVTIDTYPLIGKTSIEGLWIYTGTYRDGLHDSAFLSQYMANDILGNQESKEFVNKFTPERLPIQTMSIEETIDLTVKSLHALIYEYGYNPTRLGGNGLDLALLRRIVDELYMKLEITVGIPPDIAIALITAIDFNIKNHNQDQRLFMLLKQNYAVLYK